MVVEPPLSAEVDDADASPAFVVVTELSFGDEEEHAPNETVATRASEREIIFFMDSYRILSVCS